MLGLCTSAHLFSDLGAFFGCRRVSECLRIAPMCSLSQSGDPVTVLLCGGGVGGMG